MAAQDVNLGMQELDLDNLPDPEDKNRIEYEVTDEGEVVDTPASGGKGDETGIEVIDDTPESDRGRRALREDPDNIPEDELAEYSGKVKDRISKLRHGYHDERRAKERETREKAEALRYAQLVLEENRRLKQMYSQGEKVFGETLTSAAQSQLDLARRKVKEAFEAGDADRLVEAQEELAAAKYRAEAAQSFSSRPVAQQEDSALQSRQHAPQARVAPQTDQRAQDWMADNPWFGSDNERTSFALGVHKTLVESGIDPRSSEYYERIDARLRQVFPDKFGVRKSQQKTTTVVAPPSRSGSANPKKITLTRSQVAIAQRLGVPVEDYARQVALMERKNG